MDFISIKREVRNKDRIGLKPVLMLRNNKDLLVKGGVMHAFWDGTKWNDCAYQLIQKVDLLLETERQELLASYPNGGAPLIDIFPFHDSANNTYSMFNKALSLLPSSEAQLDSKIIFKSTPTRRDDYAMKRLDYDISEGPTNAFDEMFNVLYEPEELEKILWAIGSILLNKTKHHSKFLYLYGAKGTGKGTALGLIKLLTQDYHAPIDLNILTSNNAFATGQIKEALVLIDDDSDISKIENDTILLKLTSHEPIGINRKHISVYDYTFEGMLVTASNQPFKVRNIESGITRRALVVRPSNQKLDRRNYDKLWRQIKKEIPHIAKKACDTFERLGLTYYDDYIDTGVMEETNTFHRFMVDSMFELGDEVSLARGSVLFKQWLEDEGYSTVGYKKQAKREFERYYEEFSASGNYNHDKKIYERNVYRILKQELFKNDFHSSKTVYIPEDLEIEFKECDSFLDLFETDSIAQYSNFDGFPRKKWDDVSTTLKDLDTSQLHYVQLKDKNHIVVDFDIKNDKGEKDLKLNVQAASKFPETYAELSKSGAGVHLHYIYNGDVSMLEPLYDDDIEVKVYTGKSALRRKLSLNNGIEIAYLEEGFLPLKKENTQMIRDVDKVIKNELELREMIDKNIRKQIHPSTKPSIDFIVKLVKEAEDAGVLYDIRDLREDLLNFALSSTNQSYICSGLVGKINYCTIEEMPEVEINSRVIPNEHLYFYDIEVFPNVTGIVYKKYGDPTKHKLINPTAKDIDMLLTKPLVGFNNRGYDNHILWAIKLGYTPYEIFQVSQRIIDNDPSAKFMQAYSLSYTDIYCYSTKKQSLKKWEVELGLKHDELEFDWDQDLPEEHWDRMMEYCENDVDATEAVFEATQADYTGRCILAELTGMTPNDKTTNLTAALIFGKGNKNPQNDFIYTDLSKEFPGYSYSYDFNLKRCVSRYNKGEVSLDESFKHPENGIDPSEGGYIYAEPGAYENVALLDVESMHPSSLIIMNYFGPYTQNYADLKQARIHIKHGDLDKAGEMFDGKLKPYLKDKSMAKALSYALKIAINIVYGMTSAKFDNPFKHPDNVDNIVAKRGALFMIELQLAVQAKGYTVCHVKTDSIKIANADQDIIDFVFEFGEKYQYKFEHEATYEKFILISKTDYVAYDEYGWHVTGATFQNPYVYKKCISHEDIEMEDLLLTKSVKDAKIFIDEEHVGKVANVYASVSGGEMTRRDNEGKISAVAGTKDYLWKTADHLTSIHDVDLTYYDNLAAKSFAKAEVVIGDRLCSDGSKFLYFGNRDESLLKID